MDATILEHFNIIREDTNSTRQQFPDSEMLKIYNRARNAIESRIKTLNKKYFYTEWVADLEENQSEYSIPIEENGYPACTEVLQVAIKTNTKEDYVNLGVIDVLYNNDIDALRKNGNGYVVMDNSIFIFPEPKKSVV